MPAIVRILALSLSIVVLGACDDAPRAKGEVNANQVSAIKAITGPADTAPAPSPLLPRMIEPKPLVKVQAGTQGTIAPRLSSQKLPRATVESDTEAASQAASLSQIGVATEYLQTSPADQNTGAVRASQVELVVPISAPKADVPNVRANRQLESVGSLADG